MTDKIPFISMFYEHNKERHIFNCDFPEVFITKFEHEPEEEYKIYFFFVMGKDLTHIKTLADAIQFCRD